VWQNHGHHTPSFDTTTARDESDRPDSYRAGKSPYGPTQCFGVDKSLSPAPHCFARDLKGVRAGVRDIRTCTVAGSGSGPRDDSMCLWTFFFLFREPSASA